MKPASELPWGIEHGHEIVSDNKNKVVCDATWHNNIDPAYIVHAANHYPELVEALRDMARQLDDTQDKLRAKVQPGHGDYLSKDDAAQRCDRMRDDARAILAKCESKNEAH